MITFHPVLDVSAPFLGVGYVLRTGDNPMLIRLSALQPQVQFVLQGGMSQSSGRDTNGSLSPNPRCAVIGRSTAASTVLVKPRSHVVGIGLQSSAWRRATGVPANGSTDTIIDGAALWGDAALDRLLNELAEADGDDAAVVALSRFVLACILGRESGRVPRLTAVDAWLATAPHATIDGLIAKLSLSNRQAERLVLAHYGVSPKFLERKYRILRLAAAAAIGKTVLPAEEQDVALEGFADQSHFIRSFKQFTAFTPGRYQCDQAETARAILIGRWRAGGRTPFTLWS